MANDPSSKTTELTTFPLLPLRDVVVFPHMVIPLFVGRPKSIKALEIAMEAGKSILLVAQKSAAKDEPVAGDLYAIGSVANILQMLKLPDGTVKVLVEGTQRARIVRVDESARLPLGRSVDPPGRRGRDARDRGHAPRAARAVRPVRQAEQEDPARDPDLAGGHRRAGRLADTIAAHLPLKLEQKQEVLEMFDVGKRLEHLLGLLEAELDILQVEKRIRGRVKRQMEKSQREYYLNEQVKAIQKELGEGEDGADLDEMEKKIKAAHMPKEARRQGEGGAEEAAPDVADVGRSDRGAQLHRHAGRSAVEEEEQDQQGPRQRREDPRRGPLRPGEGQGAHRRVPRGAAARRPG